MNLICSPQKLDERLSRMTFVPCAKFVSHTTFNLEEYILVNILITVILFTMFMSITAFQKLVTVSVSIFNNLLLNKRVGMVP